MFSIFLIVKRGVHTLYRCTDVELQLLSTVNVTALRITLLMHQQHSLGPVISNAHPWKIKSKLIRIIGIYYMNSALQWIFPSTPCRKHVLPICSLWMHANLHLLSSQTSSLCCKVQRDPCFYVSLYFLLTSTIRLLKGCCVVSKSWNLLYLLTEITVEPFGSSSTFNTWDLASLENDLISCFLSRSLCGPVRAAAAS